jgi:hypothetical protein
MINRQTFAWILHHLTEGRRGLTQDGLDTDYGHLYPPQSALSFAGGLSLFTTYCDKQQLPAVGEKYLFDNVPGELGTANAEGRIAFRKNCIRKRKVELLVSQSSWIRPSAKPIPSSRAYSSIFVMVP